MAERMAVNHQVRGSNPRWGAIYIIKGHYMSKITKQGYIRVAVFQIEEVIPFIFTESKRNKLKSSGHGYRNLKWINASRKKYPIIINNKKQIVTVTMGSHRYQLFALKGTNCVKCGIKGKFFALEQGVTNNNLKFHFNLYGIDDDGNDIMITKDHIIPRSKGGRNVLDNYQPLCYNCNQHKADKIEC